MDDPNKLLSDIHDTLQRLLALYDQRTRESAEFAQAHLEFAREAERQSRETYARLLQRQSVLLRLWAIFLVLLGGVCTLLFLRALR
ncbi:MAG: hypothetical protein U0836_04930 [Pirellulales bacterium]